MAPSCEGRRSEGLGRVRVGAGVGARARVGVRARARVGVGVRVRRRVRSSDRVSSSDHRVARPYVGSDPNP